MAISAGLRNLPWLYTGTFVAMLVLTPLFGALVARVRKPLLLPITYGFFASNLLAFYLLFKAMPDARWLAVSFFIWLSAFNMRILGGERRASLSPSAEVIAKRWRAGRASEGFG